MSATIKIKRSSISGSPSSLAQGELAYSYLLGSFNNGGDRLYIGTGTETNGVAANIEVIGGKYFTAKLDHSPGVLTANSAIITDSNNKIEQIIVDNLLIDGNSITASSGGITLVPYTGSNISISNSRITDVLEPVLNSDAATKRYVDSLFTNVSNNAVFSFTGDVGSDTLILGTDSLNFIGGVGISSQVLNNSVTFNLEDTGVISGTYGSSTQIPIIAINSRGQITSATVASISTNLSISGDSGSDTVSLISDTLNFNGGVGVTTSVLNNSVTISIGQDVSVGSDVVFNNLTVSGNLTVRGNTTVINTEEILIADPIIFLNSSLSANTTPYQNAGISINRGNSNEVSIIWDEVNDYWSIGSENFVANRFIGSIDAGSF